MNILKKLITAVLFTSASVSLTLAVPSNQYQSWALFSAGEGYEECMEPFKALLAKNDLTELGRRAMLGNIELLQRRVVNFCNYHASDKRSSSYHRALVERVVLTDMRTSFAKKYVPDAYAQVVSAHEQECSDLLEEIYWLLPITESPLSEEIKACYNDLFNRSFDAPLDEEESEYSSQDEEELTDEDTYFEDAREGNSGALSPDSEVASFTVAERTELPSAVPVVAQQIDSGSEDDLDSQAGLDGERRQAPSPFARGEDEAVGEPVELDEHNYTMGLLDRKPPAPQTNDALVAAGTLACATAAYAAARKLSVRPRNAGALAGLIGLAGAAYSAYEHQPSLKLWRTRWQGKPKQD